MKLILPSPAKVEAEWRALCSLFDAINDLHRIIRLYGIYIFHSIHFAAWEKHFAAMRDLQIKGQYISLTINLNFIPRILLIKVKGKVKMLGKF